MVIIAFYYLVERSYITHRTYIAFCCFGLELWEILWVVDDGGDSVDQR